MSATPATKLTREERLESCLKFFRAVIQSGEAWTSICETEYGLAMEPDPEPPKNMQGFACIACGCVNLPRDLSTMTVERIYPDDQRDREVEALKREIVWLRETHRHMIAQLVACYELVPPPTPTFIPNPPPPRTTVSVTLDAARVEQLLAIERIAKAIVNPEMRHAILASPKGTMAGSTVVSNSQFSELTNAVIQGPGSSS